MAKRICLECSDHFGSEWHEEYLHPTDYQCSSCMADQAMRMIEGPKTDTGYYALLEHKEIDIVTGEIINEH